MGNIFIVHTVPKVINFSRYNMKCSGENVILRGIVHVVSCFPLHFMLSLKFELLFGRGEVGVGDGFEITF